MSQISRKNSRLAPHIILQEAFPQLAPLISSVDTIPVLEESKLPVAEAVTKIVVGQMLSRQAAQTIYGRMNEARKAAKLSGSWLLSEKALQHAGLSRRKVRTIVEFSEKYAECASEIEAWRHLDYVDLCSEVKKLWGLSQWSADMLAIFHFAKPDVFPETDGTIVRVRSFLEKEYLSGALDPSQAKPFRSYLALYLWAFLDQGILPSKNC